MSEQFCLRWNNHQSTLISVFETLLESGSLIDCTLCAEGQLLKGHKVVLSACSPIFESMLCIQEDKHPIIFLKDVKFIELKAMLDYMYKGEVNILQDQLDSFLRTAAALQIKGLTDQGGGGGDEPPAKKGPGRKTGMSDAPESPLVGNAPLREGSVSPTRRRRRLPRRPSSAEDASADNCDIPPPAVAPPAITPATQAPLPVVESLQRSSLTVKAKQEPIDTPLVTPKQEFVEETNEEIEDLTLDDDDDYNDSMSDLSKPGTSYGAMNPGSTSQQDFSQWQQMMGAADRSGTDEVFMAAQEAINNQANTQGRHTPFQLLNNSIKTFIDAQKVVVLGFHALNSFTRGSTSTISVSLYSLFIRVQRLTAPSADLELPVNTPIYPSWRSVIFIQYGNTQILTANSTEKKHSGVMDLF